MTPSPDWTSGLPPCFYESRRPFRVMRKTCARPPATAFHPSVTEVEPTPPTRSLKEWVQCGPHPPGHQASSPGRLVTLCPLHPSPRHLFKPPKGVLLLWKTHLDRFFNTDFSVCFRNLTSASIQSHLLTSSVLRLFPYLLPCPLAEIRTQVVLRLAHSGWG